jgi:hypothetical protein
MNAANSVNFAGIFRLKERLARDNPKFYRNSVDVLSFFSEGRQYCTYKNRLAAIVAIKFSPYKHTLLNWTLEHDLILMF